MDHQTLAPGFLIASPRLDGGPFERAVILMVHHDDEGAMGFIVNKPLDINFGALLQSADKPIIAEIADSCYQIDVHFGGPVRVEQLWLIYQQGGEHATRRHDLAKFSEEGTLRFEDAWFLAASSDSIERFATGVLNQPYRPFVGYTGWTEGQLEAEIEDGSWLFLDFQEDMVLDGPPEERWAAALSRLGVDPMAFMMMGKAGTA